MQSLIFLEKSKIIENCYFFNYLFTDFEVKLYSFLKSEDVFIITCYFLFAALRYFPFFLSAANRIGIIRVKFSKRIDENSCLLFSSKIFALIYFNISFLMPFMEDCLTVNYK